MRSPSWPLGSYTWVGFWPSDPRAVLGGAGGPARETPRMSKVKLPKEQLIPWPRSRVQSPRTHEALAGDSDAGWGPGAKLWSWEHTGRHTGDSTMDCHQPLASHLADCLGQPLLRGWWWLGVSQGHRLLGDSHAGSLVACPDVWPQRPGDMSQMAPRPLGLVSPGQLQPSRAGDARLS